MKRFTLFLIALPALGHAIDHSKLDFGRPLRIDDAHPLALGEMALEFGASSPIRFHRSPRYDFETSYLYGIAPAMHVEIGVGAAAEGSETEADGHVSLFFGITRETANTVASALRLDARVSVGFESLLVRGIVGGQFGEYGKWHANGDVTVILEPSSAERSVSFAAALGYSSPLGMPKDFTQTIVAAVNVSQGTVRAEGWTGTFGIALRKQVGVRDVSDVGLEADFLATSGAPRTALRLTVGYSRSF